MLRLVLFAAALRAVVIGYCGVSLGLYAAELRFGPGRLGVLIGLGLAGNAAATGLVALAGERLGRRRVLLVTAALSALGLGVLGVRTDYVALAAAMLVGMVNGMGRDRGPANTVEQAILADSVAARNRTSRFVRYTLVQDLGGALGSLGAALPVLVAAMLDAPALVGYRVMFAAASAAMVAQVAIYTRLRPAAPAAATAARVVRLSPRGRARVARLSGLFALDSLGGGLLAGSILAYWFFRRFGLSPGEIGWVFLWARLLNALSYFGADWLARRIGLVHTMVYTHLPTSMVLAVLPLVASPVAAVALFLFREALVQMDVPARQSYVAAVVAPAERTTALGVTNLTRYVGWAAGPPVAGWAMAVLGLGAPLFIGAGLKAAYDLLLFASFRGVRAPEEAEARAS
jgi:MFS family permease